MSRVVVMGEAARVTGFLLAGATVVATDEVGADAAWQGLPDDVGLLVLTPAVADALAGRLPHRGRLLWTVLPS